MKRLSVLAGCMVGGLAVAGCAPETEPAEPTNLQRAEAMGWPCGENVVGLWTDPEGNPHVIVDDGREGNLAEAPPAMAECLRANGLAQAS